MIHGGGFIALIFFSFYLLFKNIKIFLHNFFKSRLRLFNLIILLASSFFILHYLLGEIAFSKIGSLYNLIDLNYLQKFTNNRTFGSAAYPNFLMINSIFDIIWVVPLRICYFLFL